jgi:aryl-alcohol dehydrogenase-like predicted oxidoreductase
LVLGTAQFGLNYGIANHAGQTTPNEARHILRLAASRGVRIVDTAVAYGDSESRLGDIGLQNWGVISKIPGVPDTTANVRHWVKESVESSLSRLRIVRLHGLLLHQPEQLLGPAGPALYAALLELKNDGLAQNIGISIYDPSELDELCLRYDFDIVQCPFNVLDRRLIDSGWLYRLREQGTQLHVRSIFLQGLLLMSRQARPAKFSRWSDLWSTWEQWLERSTVTPLQACLNFALSFPEIRHVVLGVDHVRHLQEILAAIGRELPAVPENLRCRDLDLINPSRWNTLQ